MPKRCLHGCEITVQRSTQQRGKNATARALALSAAKSYVGEELMANVPKSVEDIEVNVMHANSM